MMALLRCVAGLVGWAIAFSMLYGLHGLSCALSWHELYVVGVSIARLLLLLIYFSWIGGLAWLSWTLRPMASRPGLLAWLAFASAIAGLVSTVYTGLPVLVTGLCHSG